MIDWNPRANDLFVRAAAIEMPTERQHFLDEQCGSDRVLRQQVESLLSAGQQIGNFLNRPAVQAPGVLPIAERLGTAIGPYKLLQEIGEGGMGTVFLAEQTEPVRRKVALKIIKAGLDLGQVIARFEAERQALAMMDHPNIAKVLDAGTTASGRPYFVMELVKGVSIITYCDENRLTPRQRLELFIPVCQAIQHAHQKGIIHRDIKPSNVLVALYDGKPVPKVIDFGIAKATDQQLTEKTLFTKHGQIVGTFEYMSPEQATLDTHDVDTRSDIYSLGVLLYELLTGTTPLDKDRLRQAAFLEVLRLIREEEAPRPSSRLSESRGALVAASVQRQTDADKLLGLVTGELDWIVMKSLDKDRTRRYATAAGLALDVEHYLKDEQVEACPPTAGYRLRKFVRRHKGPVLTAATVLVVVLAGIVGTSWGWIEALAQRDDAMQARKDEAEQRRLALANAAEAKTNEQKAKEAGDEAHRLAKEEKAAREQSDKDKAAALLARQKAEASETKAEWQLYASNIASAQRELETDNFGLFDHYLQQCRPEFRGWEHDFLDTLGKNHHQTLRGHTDLVFGVAFSPDGKQVASASWDKTVKLWDAASGQLVHTLQGHDDKVRSVAYSPDGKLLASASWDKTVKLWDSATGQVVKTITGHTGTVWSVAFSPDGKHLASTAGRHMGTQAEDADVRLWDVSTGQEIRTFKGHTGVVYGVAFKPDGKLLASASMDGTVKLWDLAGGAAVRTLEGATNWVYGAVAFSPDGELLACRSIGTVKLWDVAKGQELRSLKAEMVGKMAFSPDSKILACGADTYVKLWNAATGDVIRTLKAHTGAIQDVAFSPDGKRLASAGNDNTVMWWNLANEEEVRPLRGNGNTLAFSPGGKHLTFIPLANGGDRFSVILWDLANHKEVRSLKHTGIVRSVAFSPDDKRMVSTSWGHFKVFNLDTGLEVSRLPTGNNFADCVAFSPKGQLLATLESYSSIGRETTNTLKLWDADTGAVVRTLEEYLDLSNLPGFVAFSHDGNRLASTSSDNTVKVWDLARRQKTLTLEGHTDKITCVAFSSVGKLLASSSTDKSVKLWDSASGLVVVTLNGHTAGVNSVVFSPDGKRLASASEDKTVKLWDATSGQEVLTLKHTASVSRVAFSPDGRLLAGIGSGTIRIWNASKSMKEGEKK